MSKISVVMSLELGLHWEWLTGWNNEIDVCQIQCCCSSVINVTCLVLSVFFLFWSYWLVKGCNCWPELRSCRTVLFIVLCSHDDSRTTCITISILQHHAMSPSCSSNNSMLVIHSRTYMQITPHTALHFTLCTYFQAGAFATVHTCTQIL